MLKKYILFYIPFITSLVCEYLIFKTYEGYWMSYDIRSVYFAHIYYVLYAISLFIFSLNLKKYSVLSTWVFIL
ncbi:hypothetical protein LJC02_04475, partial [Breznakia sp. OttesenSCG-928-G09]|nr:hypothetical protein [Breznakia sp. OttesenSCG-928-G09]